jgi:uncharacterized OsmC-like protein
MSDTVTVKLKQLDRFRFEIDFAQGMPALHSDEAPPLGTGTGPAPSHLLAAAVGNCLSASLFFAFDKFKQDPAGLTTVATARLGRNAENRLRILGVDVQIQLGAEGTQLEHLDRILGQFEAFCTVTQSVQAGVPVHVSVADAKGAVLKA